MTCINPHTRKKLTRADMDIDVTTNGVRPFRTCRHQIPVSIPCSAVYMRQFTARNNPLFMNRTNVASRGADTMVLNTEMPDTGRDIEMIGALSGHAATPRLMTPLFLERIYAQLRQFDPRTQVDFIQYAG